jgi:hypothetical protein
VGWGGVGRASRQARALSWHPSPDLTHPSTQKTKTHQNSHTLGGFYLARYTDSPVGAFDELVAMAGLVWNVPTSCAWAARVYVSNKDARDHGVRAVGLPSRVATFSAVDPGGTAPAPLPAPEPVVATPRTRPPPRAPFARAKAAAKAQAAAATPAQPPPGPTWWEAADPAGSGPSSTSGGVVLITEEGDGGAAARPVVGLALPPTPSPGAWGGPRLSLSLPSFSGGTPACPALLQYACALATRVRPLAPARVLWPAGTEEGEGGGGSLDCLHRLLRGRPLVALQFGDMTMTVQEPVRVAGGAKAGGGGRSRRGPVLLA